MTTGDDGVPLGDNRGGLGGGEDPARLHGTVRGTAPTPGLDGILAVRGGWRR